MSSSIQSASAYETQTLVRGLLLFLCYEVGSFHMGAILDSHHAQTPLCGYEEHHSLGWLY